MLEQAINNVLEESKLASYKITGKGSRTTIVLRFDADMADASVSPIHQSIPQGCYRRKSPGQKRRDGKRLQQKINLSRQRIGNQNCSLSIFSEIATKIQAHGDDSALHSQSDLDPATSTRRQAEQSERQKESSPNNSIKLCQRTHVEKDQLVRNERQPFDSTPSNGAMTAREESILTMHRSNQNTGLCNSQVDHDDTPRSVSQYINKPERRKRTSEHADSSRFEQKHSQETGLTASDTLSTDSSEDDTTTPILIRHSKHINTTPLMKKANPKIFSEESRSVVIKCNQRYSS